MLHYLNSRIPLPQTLLTHKEHKKANHNDPGPILKVCWNGILDENKILVKDMPKDLLRNLLRK
jgi:hypothetical protein